MTSDPTSPGPTRYFVDRAGTLVSVGEGWDVFARANGAPELASRLVIGRPLADYVAGATTCHLCELLFAKAWDGESLEVPFRCDSPFERRPMRLRIERAGDLLRCEAVCDAVAPRDPVRLLDAAIPRNEAVLTMCAWCKRVRVEPDWVEIEDAVVELGLLEVHEAPMLTHGICPSCRAALERMAT